MAVVFVNVAVNKVDNIGTDGGLENSGEGNCSNLGVGSVVSEDLNNRAGSLQLKKKKFVYKKKIKLK